MPLISRLYTPPTCTLEITARTSALSRWLQRPAVRSLQFLLRFEGQSGTQPVTVAGDRDQLEALSTTVTTYIQDLLAHSTLDLPLPPPILTPIPSIEVTSLPSSDPRSSPHSSSSSPSLRPRSLLTHDLNLGPLATDISGSTIPLKVSQLFDLAEALDCCAAELTSLPVQTPQTGSPATPLWVRSAAMMVFLVGASAVTLHLMQGSNPRIGEADIPTSQTQDQATRSPSAAPPAPSTPSQSVPSRPPLPKVALPSRSPNSSPPNELADATRRTTSAAEARNQAQPSVPPQSQSASVPVEIIPRDLRPTQPQPTASKPSGVSPSVGSNSSSKQGASQSGTETAPPEDRLDEIAAAPPPVAPIPSSPEFAASDSLASGRARPQPQNIPPESAAKLGDVIPQVAQVRHYLAQRWQVPPDLTQTLQYTLVLNPDGSLQQVTPRGLVAQEYRDRLPLPTPNQPFVAPLTQPGQPKIRLVLTPNGQIQTFLESRN